MKLSKLISTSTLLTLTVSFNVKADDWQFQVTPYLWLPTIGGSLVHDQPPGGGAPEVDVGPTDWLELLNFAALVSGTARNGKFSIITDMVYLSLAKDSDGEVASVQGRGASGRISTPVSGSLNLDTESDLDGLTWTLAAGYTLGETETSLIDVFVGVRYFGVEVSSDWELSAAITTPQGDTVLARQGSIKSDQDLWDGIVGVRGHLGLGDGKWTLPYSLDVGTGSSELTLNAIVGLSRSFDWGDLVLAYRHLQYDQEKGGLLQDFSFSGPAFGVTFRF